MTAVSKVISLKTDTASSLILLNVFPTNTSLSASRGAKHLYNLTLKLVSLHNQVTLWKSCWTNQKNLSKNDLIFFFSDAIPMCPEAVFSVSVGTASLNPQKSLFRIEKELALDAQVSLWENWE